VLAELEEDLLLPELELPPEEEPPEEDPPEEELPPEEPPPELPFLAMAEPAPRAIAAVSAQVTRTAVVEVPRRVEILKEAMNILRCMNRC
jgi:hypothetical protein